MDQSVPNGSAAARAESKSSPGPVTGRTSFCRIGPGRGDLFEVRPGVDSGEALEIASNYLAAAAGLLDALGNELGEDFDDRVWAPLYILEMAKAVVDAVSLDGFDGVQS